MEMSADKSAEWIGEETEELESESEEESETAGGAGEAGRPLTATAGESDGSGAEDDPRDAAARGGATANVTSAAANKAGAGGRHGAKHRERERVAVRWENTASKLSGVGGEEGVHEVYEVTGEPSDVRGEGGGRKSYRVAEYPRELSRCRVSTPTESMRCPGGTKSLEWPLRVR